MIYSPNISNVVNSKTIRVFNSTHLENNKLKASFVSIPYLLKNENHNFVNQLIINTTLNTSYCTGESSLIACQANGVYNSDNIFSVILSDSSGSFSNPTIIGTLTGFASGANTLNFKIPTNIPVGSKYRIRLMASSPLTTSTDNGFNISITTIPAPTFPTQLICKGQSVVLAATCNQGTAQWYDAADGGNLITNTTVTPAATTDYFASCVQGTTCVSARKIHTVNVSNFDNIAIPLSASSCLNSDLELAVITDDNSLRYAWSGPNGFTSTSQTPIITNLTSAKVGVYTVLITNSNNCTANGTTSVSIGQTLQSLNVSGDVSVCFNGTISLTAATPVASGMTYSWSGPNSFTSTGQSISRIASTLNGDGTTTYHAGEYTVVASNTTTGCSGTNSVSIALGSPPNVFAMPTTGSACEKSTYTINWNLGGANFKNYSWSGPNGFTSSSEVVCDASFNCNHASVSIPNFTAINAGIYTITANFVDNLANTCAINASKNVSVKYGPELSISSNTAVCLGDALFFYSNANTGISSYAWTGPNNFTSSLQNPTIFTNSLAGSGVYKLTAVGINSCVGTATSFANILQSVPPIIQPTASVVLGNSITLTASGCDGTLLWFNATDNQSVTMPISPTVPTAYYTKCNLEGCVSGKSYDISVSIKPPIAISVKTGDWEDATTWDIDRVPLPIDSVIIRPNHIITINTLCYAKWLAWTGFGNLIFKSSQSKLNLFGNPIIPPPTISANPSNVIEGISVTFTATGNGTITWYKNGISLNINGSTYTVNQPVGGDVYTAKASVNGVFSVVSNIITVSAAPPTNIAPPVLSSNPSTVIEGISVTFTATGSGINWYKNGVNLNVSGTTYTVSQPVTGDIYTAKASANGLFSAESNSITVEATPPPLTVSAPVLDSSPVNVVEGIPVIFTATGSGVISWFKNGVDLNISGTNYSVNQPVRNDIYTAKRTVNTVLSGASNAITVQVPVNTGVTIIEPNKPAYYFSDGHPASYYNGNVNSPVIFTNPPRYDAANDFVWLKNDKIKIGINLKRGGQLAWASLIDATSNLVYNGYDGGFQVTIDAYQKKDGYSQDGEVAGSGLQGHPTFSYNVTQGGDYLNHAVSLIDYHTVANGYYVKMRPIHYPLTAKLSETYIEATYTIIGRSVKIEYRYTSFRTDGQWDGGGFDGAGAPACFIVNTLNKYKTYTGSSPWSFLPTQGGTLPITNMGQGPVGAHTTEYWGMVYDPQNPNSGIGVYNQTNGGNSTYFTFKQQEVFPGNGPGTEFTSGYTFFQPFVDFTIPNRGNYVKDITAYLMIGSETEIRKEVYKFSGHEANIPVE